MGRFKLHVVHNFPICMDLLFEHPESGIGHVVLTKALIVNPLLLDFL